MIPISDLAFHQRLGRVLDQLGHETFWEALANFLSYSVRFDTWVALIFLPQKPPELLGFGGKKTMKETPFADYMRSFYAIDPYYLFSMRHFEPGLYLLDDVAPEYFRETEYYQRYFKLNVVEDELQFLLPMPSQGTFSLSLASDYRFSDQEIGSLCIILPWLLPMMRSSSVIQTKFEQSLPSQDACLESQLQKKAAQPLTDREIQTAILLLSGHSTKTIAINLDISPQTVKVHRRHLYEKLNVSSQGEIFALFMAKI